MLKELAYTEQGTVECIMEHPVYGDIPYHATPYDVEPTGQALWAKIINGDYGPIAEYKDE